MLNGYYRTRKHGWIRLEDGAVYKDDVLVGKVVRKYKRWVSVGDGKRLYDDFEVATYLEREPK